MDDLTKMTLQELQAELQSLKLNTKGKKADLVKRLREYKGNPVTSDMLGYITPIPYCQGTKLAAADRKKVSAYYYKLAQTEWPSWLMTFELWCHMTGYEPGQPMGGPKFQKMMLLLLGAPHTATTKHPLPVLNGATSVLDDSKVSFMWDAENGKYGEMFVNSESDPPKEWYMAKTGSGTSIKKSAGGKKGGEDGTAHIPKTARPTYDFVSAKEGNSKLKHAKLGLPTVVYNNNTSMCYADWKARETNPNFGVYGKLDWEIKANIQGKNEVSVGGAHNGQIGFGVDLEKQDCYEVTKPINKFSKNYWHPCPLFANRAAMIFGLYYYPGCEEAEYQWEMDETITQGDVIRSRGRCPNPHYGEKEWYKNIDVSNVDVKKGAVDLDNGYLYIYEENNKYNCEELTTYFEEVIYKNYGKVGKQGQQNAASEPQRPPFTTMGGIFKHDIETTGNGQYKVKNGVRNRFFLPKTTHFQETEEHHWLNYWYLLRWGGDSDEAEKSSVPRSVINPYYLTVTEDMKPRTENAYAHPKRGQLLHDYGLKMAPGKDKDGFDFGFAISQTLLLWPHNRDTLNKVNFVSYTAIGNRKTNALPAGTRRPGFIPRPKSRYSPPRLATGNADLTGYAVLYLQGYEDFVKLDKEGQRRYLLTDDTSAQPVAPQQPVDQPLGTLPSVDVVEGSSSDDGPTFQVDDAEDRPEGVTNEVTQDGSNRNTDSASADTSRTVRADQRTEVQIAYGDDGFELVTALRQCNTQYDFTESQVREYTKVKNPEKSKKQIITRIHRAMKECGFVLTPPPEGLLKLNTEQGWHWPSMLHSPWNFDELYELPGRIEMPTDTNADVVLKWGEARDDLMNAVLTGHDSSAEHRELFAINMAKILCIYFADQGIGPNDTGMDTEQKRKGMRFGINCYPETPTGATQYPQAKSSNRGNNKMHELWPAVFQSDPNRLDEDIITCIKEYVEDIIQPQNRSDPLMLKTCLQKHDDWIDKVLKVKSSMTVSTWITTPWHLQHLPYTQQFAVFKDSECYSEGCKRCCRQFYEYPYLMYPDEVGQKITYTSWGNDMWYRRKDKDAKPNECRLSPIPLHDPQFWSKDGDYASMQPQRPGHIRKDHSEVEEAGGATSPTSGKSSRGNWHHYALPSQYLSSKETEKRKLLQKAGFQAYFRRYMNSAYRSDVADDLQSAYGANDKEFYKGVVQGYMFFGRSKARYGDRDLRLQRSHKYGNTCRDCAVVLEKLGMFIHNNRAMYDSGIVFGDKETIQKDKDGMWWEWMAKQHANEPNILDHLANLQSKRRKDMSDADYEEANKSAQEAAKQLSEHLMKKNSKVLPSNLTRIAKPPSLHVQKSVHTPQRDPDLVQKAYKDLSDFIEGKDLSNVDLNNVALRDILTELRTTHEWNKTIQVVDAGRQFDSNMYRIEYRNCRCEITQGKIYWVMEDNKIRRLPDQAFGTNRAFGPLTLANLKNLDVTEKSSWYNCLIIDQFMGLNHQPNQFQVEVFLATRRGPQGTVTSPFTTQWRGDKWMTQKPDTADEVWKLVSQAQTRVNKQIRSYRQSRLFITYSLHRPVGGEVEGRSILERMANACRKLFGDDKYLSQMLVFGRKLEVSPTADRISRGEWKTISETNKADAMETFYGSGDTTSYLSDTYETHVEKVEVDGGIEIGPKMHHPHFHMMLTVNHYTYVQFDYFKMNRFLEIMFKGIPNNMYGFGSEYKLVDGYGLPFYGDNENPYVDIKLYPQDDWRAVLQAYVRKNTIPSMVDAAASSIKEREQWQATQSTQQT